MGNILVTLILVAIVAAIIVNLVRNKRKGKSSCGGDCSHCASCSGGCHTGAKDASCQTEQTEPGFHTTVLEIDGMMCSMCESHMNDAIRNNFSVKSVKSSHKTGICTVYSEEPLDTNALAEVIKKTGYVLKSANALN